MNRRSCLSPVAYVEQMERAYAAADLMLARSGAGTVSGNRRCRPSCGFSCRIRMGTASRPAMRSWLSVRVAASCWPTATARLPGSPRKFQLYSRTRIGWPG